MSRLSFRPRPLDIHKKLQIVKSIKEFEDDDALPSSAAAATRSFHLLRTAEPDTEVHQTSFKKSSQEIPTPQYKIVETYERDYSSTFKQPTSYLRARGARTEIGEFVEYDLDNEDEDWFQRFNNERKILSQEKFEILLYRLEILDHKARERAGVITPTFTSAVPVFLDLDAAFEALQSLSVRFAVFQAVYNYWKSKREFWQRPILRRLQPPPPINDTNPYNVFRPREKAHRHHTRRIQRRENSSLSFEKLRQVRRNLDQAKMLFASLIKREEKKKDFIECEVNLQRIQVKYRHEAQLVEDYLALPSFQQAPSRFASSDEDLVDSDDAADVRSRFHVAPAPHPRFTNSRRIIIPTGRLKREQKQRPLANGWLHDRDPSEAVLLFTRPLDPAKLASVSIIPPPDHHPNENASDGPPHRSRGRMGRGGRIVFDRWNPVHRSPIGNESSYSGGGINITRTPQPNG